MSELKNLIALTKLHINQNYAEKDWVYTDKETLVYYKSFAQSNRGAQAKPPVNLHRPAPPKKTAPLLKRAPPKPVAQKSKPPSVQQAPTVAIERESPKPVDDLDFSDFIELFSAHFPKHKILDGQPDDTRAKEISQKWKHPATPPEVLILDSSGSPSERLFLDNIARAVEARYYPTAVVPSADLSSCENPRLVIGTQALLGKVEAPHVVMEPVPHYLENPREKAKLWKMLKDTLQSS